MANFAFPPSPSLAPPIGQPLAGRLAAGAALTLPIVAPATLLGTDLAAEWDARAGVAATTWTDQKSSIVLTASGSPTFGTDGAFFNGLSVWKIASGQFLNSGTVTAFIATNLPFYVSMVCRFTSGVAANKNMWRIVNSGGLATSSGASTSSVSRLTLGTSATSVNSRVNAFNNSNTDVHRFEFGQTGSIGLMHVDGIEVGGGVVLAVTQRASEAFSIPTATSPITDFNVASIRVVSPYPSATVRAQLRAYDASIWGSH